MFICPDHLPNRQQTQKVLGAVNKKGYKNKKEITKIETKKKIEKITKTKSWFL